MTITLTEKEAKLLAELLSLDMDKIGLQQTEKNQQQTENLKIKNIKI